MNDKTWQNVMLFVVAFLLASFLARYKLILFLVTFVFAAFGASIWVLTYERGMALKLHRNPVTGPFLEWACYIAQLQIPMDGGPSYPAPNYPCKDFQEEPTRTQGESVCNLSLQDDQDFALAKAKLTQFIRGNDSAIHSILENIKSCIRMRERGNPNIQQPPISTILFVGKHGLGKASLARVLMDMLYGPGRYIHLDLCDPGMHLETLLDAVRRNPYQSVLLENIESAGTPFLDRLLAILKGNSLRDPESGVVVNFRHCFFFLLSHQDGEPLNRIRESGTTILLDALADQLKVPASLLVQITDYIGFHLPSTEQQAEAVMLMMEAECRKYQLELGQVDPEVIVREVQAISKAGCFEVSPGRIAKKLKKPIQTALANDDKEVQVFV